MQGHNLINFSEQSRYKHTGCVFISHQRADKPAAKKLQISFFRKELMSILTNMTNQ